MKLLTPLQSRVVGYLRRYIFPYAILLLVAMAVLSVSNALIPFIGKRFIDLLTNLGHMDARNAAKIRVLALEIAGLFLLRAIGNFTHVH